MKICGFTVCEGFFFIDYIIRIVGVQSEGFGLSDFTVDSMLEYVVSKNKAIMLQQPPTHIPITYTHTKPEQQTMSIYGWERVSRRGYKVVNHCLIPQTRNLTTQHFMQPCVVC